MLKQQEVDATKRLLGVPTSTRWLNTEGFVVEPKGIDSMVVIEEMKKLCSKSNALIHQSPPLSDDEIMLYYSSQFFRLREQCYSPWFRVRIKPNGDVLPCVEFVLGNIRKENFNSIWKGEKMQYFRTRIKKYGKFPSCDRKCCDRHFKPTRKTTLNGKQKTRVRGI
jgi:radical SAM protein with 4Fe4S-binding SPASM domain